MASTEAERPAKAAGEPAPEPQAGEESQELDLMWQRFKQLSDRMGDAPARQQMTPGTPAEAPARLKFPSLELNENVGDDTAGSELVDEILFAASQLEASSSSALPALLSLDCLFEECLRPHPPLIAALACPDAIASMISYATFDGVGVGEYNADRLAFASCKLLACGWWGRSHGVLDLLVASESLQILLEYPSRVETPMQARPSFFWARIMRTVLNEKHGEVLSYLQQDHCVLIAMLSSLATHAASETEAGPLLWEMLTDEELADLAADAGAGPPVAAGLVSSLQVASANSDEEAMSVGARLIVSMLELAHGQRISPHFHDAMVNLVPDAISCFQGTDPARLVLSLADLLLAVLSPAVGELPDHSVWAEPGEGAAPATGALAVIRTCQDAAVVLLERFLTIGERDGTSLVRRQRRQASFQFTVMKPRKGKKGKGAAATELAAQRPRIGSADLAAVRAVSRLLQGAHVEYNHWIANKFATLGLGDHCVALFAEFEASQIDLLHIALAELMEAAIVCGDLSVASTVLLSGTMGGLARFMVSTFRKTPRGICAAHLLELANVIESSPELRAMVSTSVPLWTDWYNYDCLMENERRRHVFDRDGES